MSALATNDEIKELKLSLRKPGGGQEDFFTITLAGARVVGVDHRFRRERRRRSSALRSPSPRSTSNTSVQGADGILGASSTFTDELLSA